MNVAAIVKTLEKADCKQMDGLNCFILSWEDFQEIFDRVFGENAPHQSIVSSAALTKNYGFENFELRLSSLEEGRYFVCALSEPALDVLWEKKFKG